MYFFVYFLSNHFFIYQMKSNVRVNFININYIEFFFSFFLPFFNWKIKIERYKVRYKITNDNGNTIDYSTLQPILFKWFPTFCFISQIFLLLSIHWFFHTKKNRTYYVVICNFFRLYCYSIHQWKKKFYFLFFTLTKITHESNNIILTYETFTSC